MPVLHSPALPIAGYLRVVIPGIVTGTNNNQ